MAEQLGELFLEIDINRQQLNSALNKSTAQVKKSFDKMVRVANIAGAAMAASFGAFAKSAISAGGRLEALDIKFSTVFGHIKKDADDWAKSFAKSAGRATSEVRDWMASLQDMLKPMGATTEQAFALDKQLIETAYAVGLFNGTTTAQVLDNFKSALAGSTEVVQKYGIDVKEAALQTFAYQQGVTKAISKMSALEKAQLMVNKITVDSEGALRGASRMTSTYINQVERLRATWIEFRDAVGEQVLPQVISSLEKFNTWIADNPQRVGEWVDKVSDSITQVAKSLDKLYERLGGIEGILNKVKIAFYAIAAIIGVNFVASLVKALSMLRQVPLAFGEIVKAISKSTPALPAWAAWLYGLPKAGSAIVNGVANGAGAAAGTVGTVPAIGGFGSAAASGAAGAGGAAAGTAATVGIASAAMATLAAAAVAAAAVIIGVKVWDIKKVFDKKADFSKVEARLAEQNKQKEAGTFVPKSELSRIEAEKQRIEAARKLVNGYYGAQVAAYAKYLEEQKALAQKHMEWEKMRWKEALSDRLSEFEQEISKKESLLEQLQGYNRGLSMGYASAGTTAVAGAFVNTRKSLMGQQYGATRGEQKIADEIKALKGEVSAINSTLQRQEYVDHMSK